MSVVLRTVGADISVLQPVEPKTSKEIKQALIEAGILPTREQAKQTFWSLGENWWMQIVDGEHHKYGKMVFDKGLHFGNREPGYLKGIEDASRYFVDHFDGPLTLELYRQTHHQACSHFRRGNNNGVCCDAFEIDHFRTNGTTSVYPFYSKEFLTVEKTRVAFKEARRIINQKKDRVCPGPGLEKMMKRQWEKTVVPAFDLLHKLTHSEHVGKTEKELGELVNHQFTEMTAAQNEAVLQLVDKMNEQFEQIAKRLGLHESFVTCGYYSEDFSCKLFYRAGYTYEQITKMLFEEFNKNVDEAQAEAYSKLNKQDIEEIKKEYQERAIFLIGRLFAELEWLHPWIDGQGRTDLIYLSGLLCREGLHPCILEHPYFSSTNTLESWVEYLKEGLQKFKEQRNSLIK
jgi:hypothetical protein